MADWLLLLGATALVLFGVVVLRRPRKTLDGDMFAPMDVEKGRAKSEAKAAAPVSEADEEAAAPYVAYVEAVGTNEFPTLAFDADPLGAPIPDGYQAAEPAFFKDTTADWLSAFTWAPDAEPPVPLASVQIPEPQPFDLESFTTGWTRDDVERMVAKAKAGTR